MQPITVPTTQTGGDFEPVEVIPGGEYEARLTNVQEKPDTFNPGAFQWLWTFRLLDPRHLDHPLWLWTSQKLGEYTENGQTKRSKARMALMALLGRDLEPQETLDWELDIIGQACIVSVIREMRKDGSGYRNKIVSLMPLQEVTTTTTHGLAAQMKQPAPVQVERTSDDLGLQKRFDDAKKLLGWGLPEVKECIGWIAASEEPWFKLTAVQKLGVVEYMEQELNSKDVAFDADEKPMEAAVGAAGAPASTRHRVT